MTKLIPVESEKRVTERRASPRLKPDQGGVPVTVIAAKGGTVDALMGDISARGVRVCGDVPVHPAERVKVAVALKDDVAPYEVDAVVVHRTDEYAGLRFVI